MLNTKEISNVPGVQWHHIIHWQLLTHSDTVYFNPSANSLTCLARPCAKIQPKAHQWIDKSNVITCDWSSAATLTLLHGSRPNKHPQWCNRDSLPPHGVVLRAGSDLWTPVPCIRPRQGKQRTFFARSDTVIILICVLYWFLSIVERSISISAQTHTYMLVCLQSKL